MSQNTSADATLDTAPGAEILLRALKDQGVEVIFGYPGGAVLPIYDAIFNQNAIRHILVRHEQAAVHAAEGYARSTGKVGVVLVTSGPGATNAVTGLLDALMDSIPLVCLTGQVPTHLIGKIKTGMPANLRFMAFNPRTTPVVFGEVILVGADKVASDKVTDPHPENMRSEFYLVRIAIKDDLETKLEGKPLQPGMPVDVIFKSGERSFTSYMLKPLTDQLAKSFLN